RLVPRKTAVPPVSRLTLPRAIDALWPPPGTTVTVVVPREKVVSPRISLLAPPALPVSVTPPPKLVTGAVLFTRLIKLVAELSSVSVLRSDRLLVLGSAPALPASAIVPASILVAPV